MAAVGENILQQLVPVMDSVQRPPKTTRQSLSGSPPPREGLLIRY